MVLLEPNDDVISPFLIQTLSPLIDPYGEYEDTGDHFQLPFDVFGFFSPNC